MNASGFLRHPDVLRLVEEAKQVCAGKQFSDILDDSGNQYVDLVMEGGGVLGVALVGYTYLLESVGLRFLRIGGTSAGSINALLLAALGTPVDQKSEKILTALANLNMIDFVDGSPSSRTFVDELIGRARKWILILRGLFLVNRLQLRLGLNPGIAFYFWLTGILKESGITTTAALRARMRTLPEGLRTRDGGSLTPDDAECYLALVAADISTETKVDFPRMAPLYWRDPDQVNPAMFVRASMSIPFFFQPFQVKDVPQGPAAQQQWQQLAGYDGTPPEVCTFVDGGIMSNFPIDLFHNNSTIPLAPTFGVKLGSAHRQPHVVSTPIRLGAAAFNSARHCLDYDFIMRHPDYRRLVAHIDTFGFSWLDFGLNDEEKIVLFICGVRAAAEFLRGFNWTQYKEVRRRMAETYALAE